MFVSSRALAQGSPTSDAPVSAAELPPNDDVTAEPKAPPEAAVPFGRKGQWVLLGSSNSLGVSHEAFSASEAQFSTLSGELGLDAFVSDHFSIGLDLEGSYSSSQGYDATSLTKTTAGTFAAGVRFGADVPIGALFSWYPRLTLGLSWSHTNFEDVNSLLGFPSTSYVESRVGPWLNLYAPIMLHVAPHFVLGFGPRLEHEFGAQRGGPYDGSQTTLIGAQFTVGGYWGGAIAETSGSCAQCKHDSSGDVKAPEPQFGKHRQFALTIASGASLSAKSYSHADASSTTLTLEPGFDYFITDDTSFGLDVYLTHTSGNTLDGAGVSTHFENTSKGIGPRFGVNFPISSRFSLWPRGELGAGTIAQRSTAQGLTNQHSRKIVWLDLSLPLLVHVASHFFVGLGPYVHYELLDEDQFDFENDGTTVGASALLGGWL